MQDGEQDGWQDISIHVNNGAGEIYIKVKKQEHFDIANL